MTTNDTLGNSGIIVVDEDQGAVAAPSNRFIVAITNTGPATDGSDATFTVQGVGIFEYVAANGGDGTHFDSSGSLLGSTHAAGYYESVDGRNITVEIAKGATVYGRFTSVDATDGNAAVLYLGGHRGTGVA